MSQYSPVAGQTYSLVRFWRDFRENILPDRISVAGEIAYESIENLRQGRFILIGQGEQLAVTLCRKNVLPTLQAGDKVQIEFLRADLNALNEVQTICELTLLAPQRREPVYMQGDVALLQKWSAFIDQVRSYFKNRGLLEVLTPSLVQNPGMEVELEPFALELKVGSLRRKLFLPTSPELHLKQMLANGFTDIFEIKTCFRNGEITEKHEPEFQMLEWYRAYSTLHTIRDDLVGLLKFVNGDQTEVRTTSMKELFAKHLSFLLSPTTSATELLQLCQRHSVDFSPTDDWNELFHRLFVDKIEPFIGLVNPEIVYDFPPSMAALARLTVDGFADRFELFWRGAEIANAFHELNDPVEQRARFMNEIAERKAKGRTELAIDENFMRALEAGLPPSGGIALGLDRLFMTVHGVREISRSRAFSVKHQFYQG